MNSRPHSPPLVPEPPVRRTWPGWVWLGLAIFFVVVTVFGFWLAGKSAWL